MTCRRAFPTRVAERNGLDSRTWYPCAVLRDDNDWAPMRFASYFVLCWYTCAACLNCPSDQVISGMSMGNLARETFDGKTANVLRGSVSLANNGGFIQMATNLAPFESERRSVDASKYRGISLEVQSKREGGGTETFNVHIKNEACSKPYISYRAAFDVPNGEWTLVRIPFAAFRGKGAGIEDMPFDTTTLTRIGIVAIGREMKVQLAVAGIRFY